MRIFIKKLRRKLAKPRPLLAESRKEPASLPSAGHKISVETALNSRCCSDYDGDPELLHWGMFDPTKKLPGETIHTIADLARCRQLIRYGSEIQVADNMLTFAVDAHLSGISREYALVESGLQQQACALACAALGVGMVFSHSGAAPPTAGIKIDAMKPSYGGSYWSNQPPAGRKPWLPGNLPDPAREGDTPLLQTLAELSFDHRGSESLTDRAIGQLFWAARGRTPHLYKSRPWGLTIPTNRGDQDNSSVHLLRDDGSFRYVNQAKDRPTHSLERSNLFGQDIRELLIRRFSPSCCAIVVAARLKSEVALWETGYQLLNILLQARTLDLSYHAVLLDNEQLEIDISKMGRSPIAAVCLA